MKFKNIFVPNDKKVSLIAYESWTVRWFSRYGEFSSSIKEECEVFTSEEEAEFFKNSLEEAFKLIRHTSHTKVTINKNT